MAENWRGRVREIVVHPDGDITHLWDGEGVRRMELPKLLQQHSEKENRPIEVQLNEAKKLAMFFIVYAFAAWGTLFLLFVAKVFWGDVMASYIKGFKDIVDVLVLLMFTAYLASSIIAARVKRADEYVKEDNGKAR